MSDHVGVKRIAGTWAGECPQIKLSEEDEKRLEEFIPLHDSIKHEIKRELEKQGFNCSEEYPIEYGVLNVSKVVGRVDLYCTGNGVNIIIEVKSSFIGNGKPRDMMQLYLYYLLLVRQGININTALLIYRNYVGVNNRVNVPLSESITASLPGKYVYVKLRVGESIRHVLMLEELIKELAAGGYVIGRDCEYCINESCPLVKTQRLSM